MFLSREQVRTIDRRAIEEYGIPSLVLMENAGRGLAEVLMSLGIPGPVTICCGKGNNGGDGLVAARHLVNHGVRVQVLLFAGPETLSAEAAVHWNVIQHMLIDTAMLADLAHIEKLLPAYLRSSAWVIDALFGTGLAGPLRPPFDRIVTLINESKKNVLAVDIPSGLDADTGEPMGPTIRASHTVTFVAQKKGFANPAAAPWLGEVHVVDIGAPRSLLEQISKNGANA